MKENTTVQREINLLWAMGYNPIKLFGNVYLVRHEPDHLSKWPIYFIKIFKD